MGCVPLMANQHNEAPHSGELCFKHPISVRRGLFDCLANVADGCDTGIGHHGTRVGKISGLIAIELGLPRYQADQIAKAAQLHDIGKIRIPAAILRRPGKLTPQEYGRRRNIRLSAPKSCRDTRSRR
jgi:response regulator RpfG family c-di-GMP phosphodiesterase